MNISSWGNYKSVDAEVIEPRTYGELQKVIRQKNRFIPRGEGKSYGDSALSDVVITSGGLNHMLDFDPKNGIFRCQSGVTLDTILDVIVPRGWFLHSTPGTKLISVGGAIASDVHGKSHHKEGTFGEHVLEMKVMLPDGEIVACSLDKNMDLFRATCGGMGLTGVILEATFELKSINSSSLQVTTKSGSGLAEAMHFFDEYGSSDYSVAWLDCMNNKPENISSIFTAGRFLNDGKFKTHRAQKFSVPNTFPAFLLNRYTGKAFNRFYYWMNSRSSSPKEEHYDSFFYPLDSIGHWNRVYGDSGFTQYQFVVPHTVSFDVISEVMNSIRLSEYNGYLAVLKEFGKGNNHYLSFPKEGFSLALDFNIKPGIFEFLSELDEIIVSNGGRIYLTKDAHISEETFRKGYPEYKHFLEVLEKYHAREHMESMQSRRIGLSR